jgi:hypothetical protein
MSRFVLTFHSKGLLCTGDTYNSRELLKQQGGRWDAFLKGWVFPFEAKEDVLKTLGRESAGKIEDRAKVKLTLDVRHKSEQLVVSGETFPVKFFLKDLGGTWNPTLKAWTFKDQDDSLFIQILRKCPDVGSVEVHKGSGSRVADMSDLVVFEGRRAIATPSRNAASSQAPGNVVSKSVLDKKHVEELKDVQPSSKSAVSGKQSASSKLQKKQPASLESGESKIVVVGKRTTKAEQHADGSRAKTDTDKKERKISCKRTGAHVQTESVTRKRKVVESRDKIVETKTIVVKRVRSKRK